MAAWLKYPGIAPDSAWGKHLSMLADVVLLLLMRVWVWLVNHRPGALSESWKLSMGQPYPMESAGFKETRKKTQILPYAVHFAGVLACENLPSD